MLRYAAVKHRGFDSRRGKTFFDFEAPASPVKSIRKMVVFDHGRSEVYGRPSRCQACHSPFSHYHPSFHTFFTATNLAKIVVTPIFIINSTPRRKRERERIFCGRSLVSVICSGERRNGLIASGGSKKEFRKGSFHSGPQNSLPCPVLVRYGKTAPACQSDPYNILP